MRPAERERNGAAFAVRITELTSTCRVPVKPARCARACVATAAECRRRLDDILDAGKVFWQSAAVDMAVPAARRFQRRVILLLISWFDPPKSKPQLFGIDLL